MGTPRLEATFATCSSFVLTNTTATPTTIKPGRVEITRSSNFADGRPYAPSYTNANDLAIYTNADGSATVPPYPGTLTIPIVAREVGTASNAAPSTLSLVTVVGSGITGTNTTDVIGSDREDADAYRARCRTMPSTISANGPSDAYRAIALSARKTADGQVFFLPPFGDGTTGLGVDSDGNPITIANAKGDSLGVTRCYVDDDSATGIVDVYLATAGGAPAGGVVTDVATLALAWVRPQCNTVTFYAAIETLVTVSGAVKAKAGAGVSAQVIADAISVALEAAFPTYEIGGYDQTAGAGTLYAEEVSATVNGSHPKIYKVALASPSGDVALAKGHVATLANTITASDVVIG